MRVALNNMSQGLCMFDGHERLVVSNRRYAEMYALPDDMAKPGRTLASLLEFRVANGSLARDPEQYRRELVDAMRNGVVTHIEVKSIDGRTIFVTNQPTVGGGWVATHDDITERRDAERERAVMQQQERQRGVVEQAFAAFRRRVEDHLRMVTEGAMAMRATAATLLGNSDRTSTRAGSAVTASNEASVNVGTAAIAADELTSSIGEIARQLSLTTDVVRDAVGEAQGTDRQIAALAQAAQKIGDVIKLIRSIAGQTNLFGAQCHHRGGARRRGRQGLFGGGCRSQIAGGADRQGDRGYFAPDQVRCRRRPAARSAAIGRIAGRMREIDSCASAVSAAIEQQNAATAEISQNVAGASDGAKLVAAVLVEVAGAATETRQSAGSVLTASQAVEEAAAELRHEVEGFLARVAA